MVALIKALYFKSFHETEYLRFKHAKNKTSYQYMPDLTFRMMMADHNDAMLICAKLI